MKKHHPTARVGLMRMLARAFMRLESESFMGLFLKMNRAEYLPKGFFFIT